MAMVRIEKVVPLTIFEEPDVKRKVNQLFDDTFDAKVKQRVSEFVKYFGKKYENLRMINHDDIIFWFKAYFYKNVLNDAVEMSLTEKGKYNIKDNIISLLSKESVAKAIKGIIMLDAFVKASKKKEATAGILTDMKIFELKKVFRIE